MKTAKKLLILLATVSSVAALGACSQPSATNTTETEQATETTAPTAEVTPAAPTATSPTPATGAVATDNTDTTATLTSDESETVVGIASESPSFSTFTAAVEAAGLADTLSGQGPYTVFAPTDEAFAALPPGTLDELLKPENQQTLAAILQYHVIPAKVASAEIQPGEVATVEGDAVNLQVATDTQTVMVNNAKVVQPDILGSNGVIHVIDQVMLPPDVQLPTTQPTETQPIETQPTETQQ